MTTVKPHLLLKREGAITTISINDAPWNRMSLEFMDELEKVIDALAVDKSVRAIIITGEGNEHFSVGMNLKQIAEKAGDKAMMMAVLDQRLRVLSTIENLDKPVIATLFGYCLGGGLELPLACHFRLAAEADAKIGLPEMDLGTVPAWGGSARLARCVGRMHALDMILRARKISGPEAYRIGLVNEVVPNDRLKARAREIALELASMPPLAVSEMLRCVVRYGDRPLQEGLFEERRAVLRTMGTRDNIEGMTAFLEKRKPVFTGE
jgi:enoyl-CoA hydratase